MRIRRSIIVAATGLLALIGAAPAHAGLVDGSLNNVSVLSGSNILAAAANAKIGDSSNNNANTKAHGNLNFSVGSHGTLGIGADVGPGGRRAVAKARRRS